MGSYELMLMNVGRFFQVCYATIFCIIQEKKFFFHFGVKGLLGLRFVPTPLRSQAQERTQMKFKVRCPFIYGKGAAIQL